MMIPFFNNNYFISKEGIVDESGTRPDYMVCVILSKYLSCYVRNHHTMIPSGCLLRILKKHLTF